MKVSLKISKDIVNLLETPSESFEMYSLHDRNFTKVPDT
jgi:hypothetical protein